MSTLLVHLHPATAETGAEYDYVLTHDGQTVASHGRTRANLLPTQADVVAVVSAQALSWHTVELPKGSLSGRGAKDSPRLRSVLEGLLEERLLDEPEQLHFALGPQSRGDAAVMVTACTRAGLKAALQDLEAAGRPVLRIVPEFEPAAQGGDATWQVLGDAHQAWLVIPRPGDVLQLPLDATGLATAQTLTPLTTAPAVLTEPACAAMAEAAFHRPIALQQRDGRWLSRLNSPWDLAQFDLVSSNRARTVKRVADTWQDLMHAPRWRALRWGAALLLVINVAGLNLWAWHERTALQAQRTQLNSLLTQTFPGVRTVVDAPLQMARELVALQHASGAATGNDLETLMAAAAATLPPQRNVSGLDYSTGQLRLKGLRLSADEITQWSNRIKPIGLKAQADGDDVLLTQERP